MNYREIGLGTKIELELYDKNGDKLQIAFISQYEAYDDIDKTMDIHAPFFEGNIYPVHQDMIMDIIFSKESDTYSFQARVLQRQIQDNILLIKVKPLTSIRKIERRAFFRMECQLKINYRVVESLLLDEPDDNLFHSITRDISGAGACIVTAEQIEKGALIEAYLELDRKIRFVGLVVRSIAVRERSKIIYATGIEFKLIENRDRERIISYVFETQRDRLKKGWMKA